MRNAIFPLITANYAEIFQLVIMTNKSRTCIYSTVNASIQFKRKTVETNTVIFQAFNRFGTVDVSCVNAAGLSGQVF